VEREGDLSLLHFPKASFVENIPTKEILFVVFNEDENAAASMLWMEKLDVI
jgi:hypothetical protein